MDFFSQHARCFICFSLFSDGRKTQTHPSCATTPCHRYHRQCVLEWMIHYNSVVCPACQQRPCHRLPPLHISTVVRGVSTHSPRIMETYVQDHLRELDELRLQTTLRTTEVDACRKDLECLRDQEHTVQTTLSAKTTREDLQCTSDLHELAFYTWRRTQTTDAIRRLEQEEFRVAEALRRLVTQNSMRDTYLQQQHT